MRAAPLLVSPFARRLTAAAATALLALVASGARPAAAAAGDADTSVRVPGTTLRFGLGESALAARGFRRTARDVWQGECRFFGLPAQATLATAEGRLVSARLAIAEVRPAGLRFVEDDLRRQGFRRRCDGEPPAGPCEWMGRAKLVLAMSGTALDARAARPGNESPAAADRLAPAAAPVDSVARAARPSNSIAPTAAFVDSVAGAAPAVASGPDTTATAVRAGAAGRGATASRGDSVGRPASALTAAPPPNGVRAPVDSPAAFARAVETVPAAIDSCLPVLPEAARRAGVQGRVVVHSLVDVDGAVIDARALRGPTVLHTAAVACARRWRFRPATRDGRPVRAWVDLPLVFVAYRR